MLLHSWLTSPLLLRPLPFHRVNGAMTSKARPLVSDDASKFTRLRTGSARPSGQAEAFEAAGRRSFAPFAVRDHHRGRVICDRVAAKVMCRCSGCCFRTEREWSVSGQDLRA